LSINNGEKVCSRRVSIKKAKKNRKASARRRGEKDVIDGLLREETGVGVEKKENAVGTPSRPQKKKEGRKKKKKGGRRQQRK